MSEQLTIIFYRSGQRPRNVKVQAQPVTMEDVAALPEVAAYAQEHHQVIFGFSTLAYEFAGPAAEAHAMVQQHFDQGGTMLDFKGFPIVGGIDFDCDDLIDGKNPRYCSEAADEMER